MNKIRLTAEGLKRLNEALAIEKERLDEATRIVQEQMESTSDSEDTGLEDAKREKNQIEKRIEEIEDTLARAEIVEHVANEKIIDLGANIVLQNKDTKKDITVKLVSAAESVIRNNDKITRISEDSPVGKVMTGRKKGEEFTVILDNGKNVHYKVKDISYE